MASNTTYISAFLSLTLWPWVGIMAANPYLLAWGSLPLFVPTELPLMGIMLLTPTY